MVDTGHRTTLPLARDAPTRRAIARRFLPDRWAYHYVRSKLATDPLYDGVLAALQGRALPVLDLGCGLGLLAHVLASRGRDGAYLGLDNDSSKLHKASHAAARAGLTAARFHLLDAERPGAISGLGHRGDVVILDLLQYVAPTVHAVLLEQAAAALAEDGRLVIRTGLADRDWRARATRVADVLSRIIGWMNRGPRQYPQREDLHQTLQTLGLAAQFTPLRGRTPFNNWLVVATRAASPRQAGDRCSPARPGPPAPA